MKKAKSIFIIIIILAAILVTIEHFSVRNNFKSNTEYTLPAIKRN